MPSFSVITNNILHDNLLHQNEISQLKEIITMAVEQIKQAIESFHMPPHHNEQSAMETEDEDRVHLAPPPTLDYSTLKQFDLPDIIHDLKNDIATISDEMCTLFKQSMPQQPKTEHSMEITPVISELIAELKHDIATIALEMQAKFDQQETLKSTHQPKCTSRT